MVLGKGSEVGEVLTTHAAVDAITFTGSNPVGRAIQRKAIEQGKKVQLEMGGKNPSVVLADANLPHAVEQVARGAFLSAGQKCTATSRVIVEKPIVEEFQERLGTLAKSWKLGDPLQEDTQVGPVVSKDQMQTVLDYIRLGQQEGGNFVAGGKQATELGDGYYVQPTVITDLSRESRVAREEIFGPVAAIIPARSYEEAVALANDTPFGLTASLFTNDLTKALRFVNDIRVGVVKINQESAGLEYQVPFGGAKESSSGSREQGQAAKEFFTQWKTVYMDQLPKG
jgi:aldehyde dehydrogenase (NAD+)